MSAPSLATPIRPAQVRTSYDFNPFTNLWQRRALILRLTSNAFRERFRGSMLGVAWALVSPLVMLTAYTFVFSVVLQARWNQPGVESDSTAQFALILFAGLIPFNVVAEVMNAAPRTILLVPNYVKKVVFPLEVLPVVVVGSAAMQSLVSMVVLILASSLLSGHIHPTIVLLPLAYLPLLLLCLAVSWLLASLGTYLRDLAQTAMILSQLLMFASPVFFPESMIPRALMPIFRFNPLTDILGEFRRLILWDQPLDWVPWSIWVVATAGAAYLSYVWFMKTKLGFADVL